MNHPYCHQVDKVLFIGMEWQGVVEANEEEGYIIYYAKPLRITKDGKRSVTKKAYGYTQIIFKNGKIRREAEEFYNEDINVS